MDISERLSLWKEKAKCERVRRQKDLSVKNDVFHTGYETKMLSRSMDWALKVHLA